MEAEVRGYLDLRVELDGQGGAHHAAHLSSPAGDVKSVFADPLDRDQIERTVAAISNASDVRPLRKGSMDAQDPVAEMGRALYSALFRGPAEGLLRRSQDIADSSGFGLRLVVSIADVESAALPWEFLYDAVRRDFLALSARSPIMRVMDRVKAGLPPPQNQVRVLAIECFPDAATAVRAGAVQSLYDGLQNQAGQLSFRFLKDPTPRQVIEALSGDPYDVVHFSAHGERLPTGGQAIWLRNEKGSVAPVMADQVGKILYPAKDLRLVCLDVPYTDGIAATLARATRVPAVYGIRSTISDVSVTSFARGFMTALLSGQTLTVALTQGRQAIDLERPGSREWGLPVLYTGTPDSQLTLGAWQTSYSTTGPEVAKGIDLVPERPSNIPPAAAPSRERQRLETWIAMKRKNLQALEDKLGASSYPLPDELAQAAALRDEIAGLEAKLAGTE